MHDVCTYILGTVSQSPQNTYNREEQGEVFDCMIALLPYSGRTRKSIFIHAPIHLAFCFHIRHQFDNIVLRSLTPYFAQQRATPSTIVKASQQYQQSSFRIRHLSTTLAREPQNISIAIRKRRPLRPRRACCSAARLHHFCRHYTAETSLRGTPASLWRCYASKNLLRQVCCSATWQDLVSSSMPSHPHPYDMLQRPGAGPVEEARPEGGRRRGRSGCGDGGDSGGE